MLNAMHRSVYVSDVSHLRSSCGLYDVLTCPACSRRSQGVKHIQASPMRVVLSHLISDACGVTCIPSPMRVVSIETAAVWLHVSISGLDAGGVCICLAPDDRRESGELIGIRHCII